MLSAGNDLSEYGQVASFVTSKHKGQQHKLVSFPSGDRCGVTVKYTVV